MRLIDAEKFVKDNKEAISNVLGDIVCDEVIPTAVKESICVYKRGVDAVLKNLLLADTVESKGPEWIPVEEYLPPVKEDVLVCTPDGRVLIAYVCIVSSEYVFVHPALQVPFEVEAWMELPKPVRK